MSLAAVTGASGFIGTAVVQRLMAQGWQIRALARSDTSQALLQAQGAHVVRGGLADTQALHRLTQGVDAVVHCAGRVRGAGYRAFEAVNVAGTAALLAAVGQRDIPLVALSSLAAREPALSDYARSKAAMEGLFEHARQACLVLRPPAVYGPGDQEMRALFKAMEHGIAPVPAPKGARVSLIYSADVAAAIAAWLGAPRKSGIHAIHDGRAGGYCWQEVAAIAQHLLGRRVRCLRLPAGALHTAAATNRRLGQFLRYAPMLTPGKLAELRHPDWVCDNTGLQQAVDWRPQVGLAEGLHRTFGWGSPVRAES